MLPHLRSTNGIMVGPVNSTRASLTAPPLPSKCVRTSGGREGCLRNANHTWTGGHNKNYSGCLTCFCCEPEGDLPTPEPTGILNFHAPLQNYPTSQEAALLALLRIGRSTNGATRGKIPCPWLVLDASLPNKFEGLNSAEDAEFQEVMLLERMLRRIKSDDGADFARTTMAGVSVLRHTEACAAEFDSALGGKCTAATRGSRCSVVTVSEPRQ